MIYTHAMNIIKFLKLPATEFFFAHILRISVIFYLASEIGLFAVLSDHSALSPVDILSAENLWNYSLAQLIQDFFEYIRHHIPGNVFYLIVKLPVLIGFWFYSRSCYHLLAGRATNIFSFIVAMVLLVVSPTIVSQFSWQNAYGLPLLFLLNSITAYLKDIETGESKFRMYALIFNLLAIWANPCFIVPAASLSVGYMIHSFFIPEASWRRLLTGAELLTFLTFILQPFTFSNLRDTKFSYADSEALWPSTYSGIMLYIYVLTMLMVVMVLFLEKNSLTVFLLSSLAALTVLSPLIFNLYSDTQWVRLISVAMLICSGFLIMELLNQYEAKKNKKTMRVLGVVTFCLCITNLISLFVG